MACPNNSVLLSLDATIGVSRVERLFEAPNPTQSTRRHSFAMSVCCVSSDCVCLLACVIVGDAVSHDSYLVDPASSHMLVSKIKPCMSKYK